MAFGSTSSGSSAGGAAGTPPSLDTSADQESVENLLSPSSNSSHRLKWVVSPQGRALLALAKNRGILTKPATSEPSQIFTPQVMLGGRHWFSEFLDQNHTLADLRAKYKVYRTELDDSKDQEVYEKPSIYRAFLAPRIQALRKSLEDQEVALNKDFFLGAFITINNVFAGFIGADEQIQFLELLFNRIPRKRLEDIRRACESFGSEQTDEIGFNYMNWFSMTDFNLNHCSAHLFYLSFEQAAKLLVIQLGLLLGKPKDELIKTSQKFLQPIATLRAQLKPEHPLYRPLNEVVKAIADTLVIDARIYYPHDCDPLALVVLIQANNKVAEIYGIKVTPATHEVIGQAIYQMLSKANDNNQVIFQCDQGKFNHLKEEWYRYQEQAGHDIYKRILALEIYNILATADNFATLQARLAEFKASRRDTLSYALDINWFPVRNLLSNDFKLLWDQMEALCAKEVGMQQKRSAGTEISTAACVNL